MPKEQKPTVRQPAHHHGHEKSDHQQPAEEPAGTALTGLKTEVNPPAKPSVVATHQPAFDEIEGAEALDEHGVPAIEVANLDTLEDELDYLHADVDDLITEARLSSEDASDLRRLLLINQADHDALLKSKHFSFDSRCKLLWFLKKMKTSAWMRIADEGLYVPRISLGLAAGFEHGGHMALCGLHHRFCQQPDYCPRCCLRLRAKPAVRQYRESFDRARHWMMLTPSYECDPEQAGLHYVIQKVNRTRRIKAKLRRFRPLAGLGLPIAKPLTPDHDVGKVNPITACFEAIFRLARELIKLGVAQGVFVHREIAWNFEVGPVRCWITPNGTIIINSAEPVTFEVACGIYQLFDALYKALPFGNRLCPDLHCEAILSQKELDRCLYYALKPMRYAPGYLRAVNAGANMAALNIEICDRVFQGGSTILGVHRSPRKLGNMRPNATGYIGTGLAREGRAEQPRLERDNATAQQAGHGTGITDLEKAIGRETLKQREGLDE